MDMLEELWPGGGVWFPTAQCAYCGPSRFRIEACIIRRTEQDPIPSSPVLRNKLIIFATVPAEPPLLTARSMTSIDLSHCGRKQISSVMVMLHGSRGNGRFCDGAPSSLLYFHGVRGDPERRDLERRLSGAVGGITGVDAGGACA